MSRFSKTAIWPLMCRYAAIARGSTLLQSMEEYRINELSPLTMNGETAIIFDHSFKGRWVFTDVLNKRRS